MVKMAPEDWRYYAKEVAGGLEDYYAGRGEEPGRWMGAGAQSAGIAGRVDEDQLAMLFGQGRHPVSGEVLGDGWATRSPVAGFAVSLSAPKSVSVLLALGDDRIRAEVRAAHDGAVSVGVEVLDEHAAFARAGKAGVRQLDTDGLLVAAFVHRTSRAMDPDLHTHLLIANKVRRNDGQWRALDGRELYPMQKPTGMTYQAALRAELSARLGVVWAAPDENGQADIVGVPDELLRLFSCRAVQVERRLAERVAASEAALGRTLTSAERAEHHQRATYETRGAKPDEPAETADLLDRWAAQATEAGVEATTWVSDVVGRVRSVPLTLAIDPVPPDVVATALCALGASRSTWTRAEAMKAVAWQAPANLAGADAARAYVERATDAVLASPDVVRLELPPSAAIPDGLCRRDGLGTHQPHGHLRHTTRATLAAEARVLDAVADGRSAGLAAIDQFALDLALEGSGLGADQAGAVSHITRSGDAVSVIVGPAGSGKSRALGTARRAWEADGYEVRGLAPSAMAAGVLTEEAGIDADTVAKFLVENERARVEPGWPLEPGQVVIVDEAGMVATADLVRLIDLAKQARAKVVLVGDPAQLGPVNAGGLFRLLATDALAATLTEVRRFAAPWEADASLGLRVGDRRAASTYDDHGRLVGGGREEMLDAAFTAWAEARTNGESVALLAHDHTTVDALARRARAALVARGDVESDGVDIGTATVGVGDEIVTLRNDRALLTTAGAWVRNGDRWVVERTGPDDGLVARSVEGRGRVSLPPDYVAAHVALAYALTVHKAQGMTVERGLLIVDESTPSELLYVGMTRGRQDNRAFVIAESGRGQAVPTPAEGFARAIGRPGAEWSATEVLRTESDRAEDLAVLWPMFTEAARYITAGAGPDRSAERAALQARVERGNKGRDSAREAVTRAERHVVDAQAKRDLAVTGHGEAERRARRLFGRSARGELPAARRAMEAACRDADLAVGRVHRTGAALRLVERQNDADAELLAELESAAEHRTVWLAEHPTEVVWRSDLVRRIRDRVAALAEKAVADPPDHVLRIVGAPPDHPVDRVAWSRVAGAIEAHRERWRVEPADLGRTGSMSAAQRSEWERIERAMPDLQQDHGVDRGMEMEL